MNNCETFRKIIINGLEELKEIDDSSEYHVGYNTAVEDCIRLVVDTIVPKKPITLSKSEYYILDYLKKHTKFRYIARDDGNWLFVYYEEPYKGDGGNWEGGECYGNLDTFADAFQFVQWSDDEPLLIDDILNNCEVE